MKSSLLESNIPENVQKTFKEVRKNKQNTTTEMQDSCKNSIAEILCDRIAPQQENKEWEKGVVKNKHIERSYEVQKENRRFIRRYWQYLRKTKEQFNPYNVPEDTNIKPNDTSENTNIETNHKQTTTEDETPKHSCYGR